MPSRCTTNVMRGDGSNQSRHCSRRSAFVHSSTVLLLLDHPGDDLLDPLVDERLAAADRDDRRRALQARVDALLDRQPRAVRLVLADLPAADARDVARERRLEHEHERIALALALLGRDVLADRTRSTASGNFMQKASLSFGRVRAGGS